MTAVPEQHQNAAAGHAPAAPEQGRPTYLVPVPNNPFPGPTPAPAPVEPTPSGPSPRERAEALKARVAAEFTPPDIWSKPRPSLREIRNYGRHGGQVPDGGLARAAAVAWSWFAMSQAAIGYAWAWVAERKSRSAVAVGLVALAALVPATRQVLTIVLWPVHEVIELITNY